MAESFVQVAAGQTGERIRTARKVIGGNEVHEEYTVTDVPWTVLGSYFMSESFIGKTGLGTNGILAALLRPTSAKGDIVVRKVICGWYNQSAATTNTIRMTRSTALAATAGYLTTIGKKDTRSANSEARFFKTPSGVTMSAGELNASIPLQVKPSTTGNITYFEDAFSQAAEPFILLSGEALVLYQEAAGSATEIWQLGFEWHEVSL
jgi:hypothetical protein